MSGRTILKIWAGVFVLLVATVIVLAVQKEGCSLSPSSSSGPDCVKGCRCGNSCIDCSKTCRK